MHDGLNAIASSSCRREMTTMTFDMRKCHGHGHPKNIKMPLPFSCSQSEHVAITNTGTMMVPSPDEATEVGSIANDGDDDFKDVDLNPNKGEEEEEEKEEPAELSLTDYVLGMEHRKSELQKFGSLLLILGSGAAHSALALTAVVIEGMGGREQVEGFNLPVLVGSILQCCSGMAAMIVGLWHNLSSPLNKTAHIIARALLVLGNLAPITILFSIIRVIMGSRQDPSAGVFVPSYLEPTRIDNGFVALCGIVALISVCVTLLGGLNLLSSNICAFIGDQCMTRNRLFYKLRYFYFSFLVLLGGLSQFALGVFCQARFGSGPYDNAIHVTVYTIFMPQLTGIVGLVQTSVGVFGLLRAGGWCHMGGAEDHRFEITSLLSWLMTMLFQIVVQPSYASGDAYDAEGATFASVYLGFFIIPIWLDYCVRVTPSKVWPEYYAIPTETKPRPDLLVRVYLFVRGQWHNIRGNDTDDEASSTSEESSGSSERVVL